MDGNKPVSPEVLQIDIASELTRVQQELEKAEGKIMQLELALLQSRDFAIGAAAETSESTIIRAMYADSQRQVAESQLRLDDANAHIVNHLAHICRLEEAIYDLPKLHQMNKELRTQLEKIRTSPTWRIGKLVMTPMRILKRLFK